MTAIAKLTFEAPDLARFPCLKLAFDALRQGGTASAILNAANEIAVDAFLAQRIGFMRIADVVARVLDEVPHAAVSSLEAVFEVDGLARAAARRAVERQAIGVMAG